MKTRRTARLVLADLAFTIATATLAESADAQTRVEMPKNEYGLFVQPGRFYV